MLYKSLDLFLQITLILVVIGGYIFSESSATSTIGLLAFAGLQIISILVHFGETGISWKMISLRRIHLIITGLVILVMLYGLARPSEDKYDMSGLGVVIYALIPAIATALFYTVITFIEWKKIKKIQ